MYCTLFARKLIVQGYLPIKNNYTFLCAITRIFPRNKIFAGTLINANVHLTLVINLGVNFVLRHCPLGKPLSILLRTEKKKLKGAVTPF